MPFAPHPFRMLDLPRLEEVRAFRSAQEVEGASSTPGRKTQKELAAIGKWFADREADRTPRGILQTYRDHQSSMSGMAHAVINNGRIVPDIYDVSELIDKLHEQDISDFSLARLTSRSPIRYIHFGRRADMMIERDAHVYIEGAYVREFAIDDDTKSEFHITLVCNDPEFDTSWDRPFMQTLKANLRMIYMQFTPQHTVGQTLQSLQSISGFFEPGFKENFDACRKAFDAAIKSMIYFSFENEPDLMIGCAAEANPIFEANARGGDEVARVRLIAEGTPLVIVAGRNINWVPVLDQPDYDWDDDDEEEDADMAIAI